jgi:hypothetical protein
VTLAGPDSIVGLRRRESLRDGSFEPAGQGMLSLRQYADIFAFPERSFFRIGAWRERWGFTS